jgi:phosphate starvation-inducible protein PhoH and related proteins
MSSKKSKTATKNLLAECHLQETIHSNQLSRNLKINHRKFTAKQEEYIKIATDVNTKLVFTNGPAGSAKTYTSAYCGLKLLSDRLASEIIYVRSAVESSDHKLGFLPGAQDDKMAPYLEPFKDKLEELLSPVDIRFLQEEERIYGIPVGFCRGANWENKIIIVDEAQNLTEKELITIITRAAEGSKIYLCGDAMQSDIGNKSGFTSIMDIFADDASKNKGIHSFQFTEDDIVRSELVKFIIQRLKSLT